MMLSQADRQIRKAAIASLGQTLRAYWDHEPVPDRLVELAATADEALAKSKGVVSQFEIHRPK